MNGKKYRVSIDEKAITYMERVYFENEIAKDNVSFLIANYGHDPSVLESETFRRYENKQIEAKKTYEKAKNDFTLMYIPEVFKSHQIRWDIDFRLKAVFITMLCDCELGDIKDDNIQEV